jgi:hypothetical protein
VIYNFGSHANGEVPATHQGAPDLGALLLVKAVAWHTTATLEVQPPLLATYRTTRSLQ